MNPIAALGLLLLSSLSPRALAYETDATLMGTVMAVTPGQIRVRAVNGDIVDVPVNEKTVFRRGNAVARTAEVRVDMRIVVQGDATSATASKVIRLPAASASTPSAQPAPEGDDHGRTEHQHPGGESP